MSTATDRETILRILRDDGGWVHRYSLTDHPDLAHLNHPKLTQDLSLLRKRSLIERRRSERTSRSPGTNYPTHEYRLAQR